MVRRREEGGGESLAGKYWEMFSITGDSCSNEIISILVLLVSAICSPAAMECTALENAIWIKIPKYCNLAYLYDSNIGTFSRSPRVSCQVKSVPGGGEERGLGLEGPQWSVTRPVAGEVISQVLQEGRH